MPKNGVMVAVAAIKQFSQSALYTLLEKFVYLQNTPIFCPTHHRVKYNNLMPMKTSTPPAERVLHEITPLADKDVLYIADRHKKEFTYPIHNHSVFELNFVEHAAGVRRIVGDSNEIVGDYDLVMITSTDLEHGWLQNTCQSEDIHEITIQFSFDLGHDSLFARNPFSRIYDMLNLARKGLVFPMDAIMQVYKPCRN